MRPIDADALKDTLQKGQAAAIADNNFEAADQLGLFIAAIDSCPTIEVKLGMIDREDVLPILAGLARTQEYDDSYDTAEWIYKEVRGSMTNVCSVCGSCSVYPDKYCGGCGRSMKNGC